jgi:hypothetical protein
VAEIDAGAPDGSRETATWFTLLKGGGLSYPASPRTRYCRAGCGSNRWRRRRQPSRLHRPHRQRSQDPQRRLLPLQAASRSFLPPPPSRGKFSCPHGLNSRLTRVFLGRLVLDGFPSPFYIPMASILIEEFTCTPSSRHLVGSTI